MLTVVGEKVFVLKVDHPRNYFFAWKFSPEQVGDKEPSTSTSGPQSLRSVRPVSIFNTPTLCSK